MPRRHPLCFVCEKPLGDGNASSTMRMTWAGLPGKPEIGMHWPECGDERDVLFRWLKIEVRGDPDGKPRSSPREVIESFLASVAERNPRCLVRNKE